MSTSTKLLEDFFNDSVDPQIVSLCLLDVYAQVPGPTPAELPDERGPEEIPQDTPQEFPQHDPSENPELPQPQDRQLALGFGVISDGLRAT